jgi:hypothetical protein
VGRSARVGTDEQASIEFLAPRDSAFGADGSAEFAGLDVDDLPPPDDTPPRSRWLTAAAALTVGAFVIGGVVAAAPWDGGGDAAPVPSTVPVTTTARDPGVVPLSSAVLLPDTGWTLDAPAGFTITEAWNDEDTGRIPNWGEVWAEPDATNSSGRWFSLTIENQSFGTMWNGATRVDLNGRTGLLTVGHGDTLYLDAPIGQTDINQTLRIRAHGMSADELIDLFQSVGIVDDRPQLVDDRPMFLRSDLLEGFEQVAEGITDGDLLTTFLDGRRSSLTRYTDRAAGADPGIPGDHFISISASPRDDDLEPLGRIAIGPVRIFPDSISVPAEFTGTDLVLGVSPVLGGDPQVLARWHEGETTLVVQASIPLGDMLQLLPTVQVETPNDWSAIQQQVQLQQAQTQNQTQSPFYPRANEILIASDQLESGTTWRASVAPPGTVMVQIGDMTGFVTSTDLDSVPISMWSSDELTIVVAATQTPLPWSVLRIVQDGQSVGGVTGRSLASLDPSAGFQAQVGAFAFETTGVFEVQLLAEDGTLLYSERSPGSD